MKRLWLGLLVLILVFPASVFAARAHTPPTTEELLQKINQLSNELQTLKGQLKEVQTLKGQLKEVKIRQAKIRSHQEDTADTLDDVSDKVDDVLTDGIGRFKLSGDYRFRMDSTRAHIRRYYSRVPLMATDPQGRSYQVKDAQGNNKTQLVKHDAADSHNNSLYTNRLRLNIKVKATENITFKGRLAMYKIWGMPTSDATAMPFPENGYMMDPTSSRRPNDNTLRVEMAYVNWTNIGGLPIWLSVGRRPTQDGPPAQLRYNYPKRYATPVALGVDMSFDGGTIGYQYFWPWTGRIRICYGRAYESGFKDVNRNSKNLDDTDVYGFSWDVIDEPDEHRFGNIQVFKAANIPDIPEARIFDENGFYKKVEPDNELGDIYHLSTLYMDRFRGIDWFVSSGASHTCSRNHHDKWGLGLLNNPGEGGDHWGWATYAGVRIPIETLRSKIGIEYNYGSQYWLNFTNGSDDLYLSKLATRGHVGEIYWIWDLPETPLSKYGRAFIRVGYQYYLMRYSNSGNWLGAPERLNSINDSSDPQSTPPVNSMSNVYATFEVYF